MYVCVCVCVWQEVETLHETLSGKLLAAAADTQSRRREIDVIRRHDDVKLTEARRENEALRDELDAMMTDGAKRTHVGLVHTHTHTHPVNITTSVFPV